jgi:signal transduction histidine kinase
VRYNSIQNKIIALVALPLISGLWFLVFLAIRQESAALIAQSDMGSDLLASSVIKSIESAIGDLHPQAPDSAAGAQVPRLIARVIENQRTITEVQYLQLLLEDGSDAFGLSSDSGSLSEAAQSYLSEIWETGSSDSFYETVGDEPFLTHLKPVLNDKQCQQCHADGSKIRAVVRVSTSMSGIRRQISRNRKRLIAVAAITSLAVAGVLKILVRVIIARPIKRVAAEISEVTAGRSARPVRVASSDEVGEMVRSFNTMAANLRKSQQDLVQSAKLASIGELAGSVAHEINNPAATILSRIDCLEQESGDNNLSPSMRRELFVIKKHAKIIAEVTRGLLTFARRSSSAERARVDLNALADETVTLVDRQSDKDEGLVCLRVSDTGKGIPPESVGTVFDPFFTTKEVGKGTGLGLSVSYGIVKDHGGDIKVTSDLDKGTTFLVSLPVAQETGEG